MFLRSKSVLLLGGASLGGMIAYEMTQQLRRSGDEVRQVFMIDTPGLGFMPKSFDSLDDIIHYLLNVGEKLTIDKAELQQMSEPDKLTFLATHLSQLPSEIERQHQQFVAVFQANMDAMLNYRPESLADVRGVFFAPEQPNDYHPLNLEQAWLPLFDRGLDVLHVPGNHLTMNRLPNVGRIARFLTAYLDSDRG